MKRSRLESSTCKMSDISFSRREMLTKSYFFLLFVRALDHPGIVKYFGTNLREDPRGTIPIIVLELCKSSLKTAVMSQPEDAPANLRDDVARKKVLGWVLQILDTLCYIHSQGYVHRDLKLDNLLVRLL